MNPVILGALVQTLTPLALPMVSIAATVLMGFGSMAAERLRKKTGIEITQAQKDNVHGALTRALTTLLTEHLANGLNLSSFNPVQAAITAATMVQGSNPDSVKGTKADGNVLANVALSLLPEAVKRLNLGDQTSGAILEAIMPPSSTAQIEQPVGKVQAVPKPRQLRVAPAGQTLPKPAPGKVAPRRRPIPAPIAEPLPPALDAGTTTTPAQP